MKIKLIAYSLSKEELREKFPLQIVKPKKTGEEIKYKKYSNDVIAKYVMADMFNGMFLYKENAKEKGDVYSENEGNLRFYNSENGLFEVLTENIIKEKVEHFFNKEENEYMLTENAIGAGYSLKYKKELVEIIKEKLRLFCQEKKLHWSNSFKKGYIGVVVNNGTLLLHYKNGKIEFKTDWNPNYLAEYRIDIEYDDNFTKRNYFKENRFYNFIKTKLRLNNKEKEELFLSVFFDWFLTENVSQHLTFFIGKAKSGKSTFVDWMKSIPYSENWLAVQNIANLVGKFTDSNDYIKNIIISDETSDEYINSNDKFKNIASKSMITTEQKFKNATTTKVCAKVIAVGEKPIEIKLDGGVDRRLMYWSFEHDFFETNMPLEIYLKQTQNADFLEMLILGLKAFSSGKYFRSYIGLTEKYKELFIDEIEQRSKENANYIGKMARIFTYKKNGFIPLSAALQIYGVIYPSEKNIRISTFKDELKTSIDNVAQMRGIKFLCDINRKHKITVDELPDFYEVKKSNNYLVDCGINEEEVKILLLDKIENEKLKRDFYKSVIYKMTDESAKEIRERIAELNGETKETKEKTQEKNELQKTLDTEGA